MAGPYYWVGGSGNWSDATNHWATTSGGTPNAANVPTSTDDVHFDAASNTTAYTVTVDATANCKDLMFDAAPSVSGTVTFTGSSTVNVYGSLALLSGMTYSASGLVFKATSTGKTITTNGVMTTNCGFTFNGSGGGWTLQDDWASGSSDNTGPSIFLNTGAFDTNSKNITCIIFWDLGNSTTRSLTLGSSTITTTWTSGSGSFSMGYTPTGLTVSAASSTINLGRYTSFYGGGFTYGTVAWAAMTSGGAESKITGTNTFTNLSITGDTNNDVRVQFAANQTVTGTLTLAGNSATSRLLVQSDTAGTARTITAAAVALTNCDFMDITGAGAATWQGAEGSEVISVAADRDFSSDTGYWSKTGTSITGGVAQWSAATAGSYIQSGAVLTNGRRYKCTFTVKNYSSGNVSIYCGNATQGTVRTANGTYTETLTCTGVDGKIKIGCGTTSTLDVDDVSVIPLNDLGDCQGNSGITFAGAATMYWQTPTTGSKNWSTAGNWFNGTNGGAGPGRVPLPQDNVVFDANSIGAASTTVTVDMPRMGKDITLTGVTNAPTLTSGLNLQWSFGGLTSAAGITMSMNLHIFAGRGSHTITSNGNSFLGGAQFGVTSGSNYSLGDAYTSGLGSNYFAFTGTFTDNGYTLTGRRVIFSTGCTINKSGTWVLGGTAETWNGDSTFTLNDTGTLKLTDTSPTTKVFRSNSKTYNNVWFNCGGVVSITGSPTYANLKVDPGVVVQVETGSTQTAATYTINGRSSTGTDDPCVYLDGSSGCFVTTGDSATNSITGDIAGYADVALASYTPSAYQVLVSKNNGSVGLGYSYELAVEITTGKLMLTWSPDGTSYLQKFSTVAIGAAAGSRIALGFTLDVDNGAAGNTLTFYTSTDKGANWSALGSAVVTAGVTSIVDNTGELAFGASSNGLNYRCVGKLYRGKVFNAASLTGSAVQDFDPARFSGSGNTLVASTGETYTRQNNAQFTADNLVTLMGVTDAAYTMTVTGAAFDAHHLSTRRGTWTSGKLTAHYSLDGGNNTNITFTPARYWVGGSGNFSDTTHWSLSSGGPGSAGVPDSTKDVEFDNHSNATAYTATVDATANCNDLRFGAAPATSGTVTLAGSSALNIYGSAVYLSGMTVAYSGTCTFAATTTGKTITFNGCGPQSGGTLHFNGVGGGWTFVDTPGGIGGQWQLDNGSLDINGKSFGDSSFYALSGGTRALTIGAATLTFNSWYMGTLASGLTLSAASATIASINGGSDFYGGGATYGTATIGTNGSTKTIHDANTFGTLNLQPSTNYGCTISLTANQTVTGTCTIAGNDSATKRILIQSDTLGTARTITAAAVSLTNCDFQDITGAGAATWVGLPGSEMITTAADRDFSSDTGHWLKSDVSVTVAGGALHFAASSGYGELDGAYRTAITSGTSYLLTYTIRNLSSGSVTPYVGGQWGATRSSNGTYTEQVTASASTNGLFRIYGVGGLTADIDDVSLKPVNAIGDALGNSGITFAGAMTQYWYQNGGNWSNSAKWFLGSGGTGGAGRVPLPQDNAIFDSSSFDTGSQTVTADMPRLGKDITWTGVTNSPTWSVGSATSMYGSLNAGGVTVGNYGITMAARSSVTVTCGGAAIANQFKVSGPGGTVTMQDALNSSGANGTVVSNGATLNTNGYTLTSAGRLTVVSATLTAGSSTIICQYAGLTAFDVDAGSTINAGTSTIKLTDTSAAAKSFVGGGKTYYNLWFTGGSGAFFITGSNTFNNFRADPGTIVQVTAGTTQTAATYTINGRSSTGTDLPSVYLTNDVGSSVRTPDAPANRIAGDMEVEILTDIWRPPGAYAGTLMCKNNIGSWGLQSASASFLFWTQGTNPISNTFTTAPPYTNGTKAWLKVTVDVDNGAGGSDLKYWTAPDVNGEPGSYSQLGSTVTTAGVAVIATPADPVEIGSYGVGSGANPRGRVYKARLRNGIGGTTVIDFDAARFSGSGDTATMSTGEVWTRYGTAQFTADNLVTLMGVTDAAYTMTVTGAAFDAHHLSSRRGTWTAAKLTAHYALDGGNNSNITFTPARYWVGGSGNWSDTAHWSLGSGGPSGASAPDSTIDAEFDNHSNATAYAVTTDATANVNWLDFGAAPATSGTVTWQASSGHTHIYGNLNFLTGMTNSYTWGVVFHPPTGTTKTITANGIRFSGDIEVNGPGTIQLADDQMWAGSNGILSGGTFDPNGKTVQIGNGSLSTTFRLYGSWTFYNLSRVGVATPSGIFYLHANQTVTGTFTATGNSATNRLLIQSDTIGTPRTITAAAVNLSNVDFMDITGAGASGWGGNAIDNLDDSTFASDTGNWSKPAGCSITGGVMRYSAAGTYASTALPVPRVVGTRSGLTYRVTFTVSNYVSGGIRFLFGNQWGSTRTADGTYTEDIVANVNDTSLYLVTDVSPNTFDVDNVIVEEVLTSIGDALGNSGITFTPAVTQTATGTASFTWSTHGWTSRVPLPQDDVVIPNAFSAGRTITLDMPRAGKNITFSCTGSPALNITANPTYMYGSLTLASGMTWNYASNLIFAARSGVTFTSSGVQVAGRLFVGLGLSSTQVTLGDALTVAAGTYELTHTSGTFDTGGFSLTIPTYGGGGATAKTLNLNGSTVTLTDSGIPWNVGVATINAGTSTIKLTNATSSSKQFTGQSKTYNNLWLSGGGTGTFNISGSNTFNQFRDDEGLAAHSVLFTAGTTQTAAAWLLRGASGKVLTVGSQTAAGHSLVSTNGADNCDYLSISRSAASPTGNSFFAGDHSTDDGNNTGWQFRTPRLNGLMAI